MDLLKNILSRIKANDSEVQEMVIELDSLDKDDFKTKNEIRSLISKFNNDTVKLLQAYHNMNQDLRFKNEEINARILLLKKQVDYLEKEGQGEAAALQIIEHLNEQTKKLSEGVSNEEN